MPKSKRMRLPNGFGQISEIKNQRLREPFRAMVTIGKTDTGKPICKLLKPKAYFRTYNEAYAALIEYNRNPYSSTGDMTGQELFDEWYIAKEKDGVTSAKMKDFARSWKYCSLLYKMRVEDVRTQHIRDCIENGEAEIRGKVQKATPMTQRKIKTLLSQMFDYALSYDLVQKNYARNYKTPKNIIRKSEESITSHISYTDEEMKALWMNVHNQKIQMIVIQCYSGWRPQELMNLKISDVNLEKWTFTGGSKTKAGRNRTVPIHPKIRTFIQENYENAVKAGCEYLFVRKDGRSGKIIPYTYHRWADSLDDIIKACGLNPDHRLHDGRKQFVTMCKRYEVNEYAIKRFVGHTISDITERIYTDRTLDWYQAEIAKIK